MAFAFVRAIYFYFFLNVYIIHKPKENLKSKLRKKQKGEKRFSFGKIGVSEMMQYQIRV